MNPELGIFVAARAAPLMLGVAGGESSVYVQELAHPLMCDQVQKGL